MIKEGLINQLESIIEDKKHFVDKDDPNDIFKKDIEAIKQAIFYIKNFETIKEITQTFPATKKDNVFIKEMPYNLIIASDEYFLNGIFTEHFISKDKIRKKIKKLEMTREMMIADSNGIIEISASIDILKELLEGDDK